MNHCTYHLIEFSAGFTVDLEISPKHRLERLRIRAGMRVHARVAPYVLETNRGLIEAADLWFEDGSVVRSVPYAHFHFVD